MIYNGDDERYKIIVAKNQYFEPAISVFIFDGFELYELTKEVYTAEQAIELVRKQLIPAFRHAEHTEDLFDICLDHGFTFV